LFVFQNVMLFRKVKQEVREILRLFLFLVTAATAL
jgi:hypothetical protein